MSISEIGFKRIIMWKKGALPPYSDGDLNALSCDLRKSATLKREPVSVTDVKGRELHNFTKFTAEMEIYNVGRPLLYNLLYHAKNKGVDCELLAEVTGVSSYSPMTQTFGGRYRFNGARFMGIDFEYMLTKEERMAKISLAVKLPKVEAKTLIDDAQTNTVDAIGGITVDEYTPDQFRPVYLESVTIGDTPAALFDVAELSDFSMNLKTSSKRTTILDRSVPDYLEVDATFTCLDATKTKIQEWENIADNFPKFVVKMNDGGGKSEEHIFAAKTVSIQAPWEISDEKREMTFTVKGMIPLMKVNTTTGSYGVKYYYYL